ncbi:MAG: hypothetical protein WC822_06105 [Candidatus Paceibacterota bacterium]|jgi:hypothetical protein
MDKVRAKFKVSKIERYISSVTDKDGKWVPAEVQNIVLQPVMKDGKGDNNLFFAATPSGKIELGVLNLDAAKNFELEKEYYVDFVPAV